MKSRRKKEWEWEVLYCIDKHTVTCKGFCADQGNGKNTTLKLEIKNYSKKNSGAEKSSHRPSQKNL